MADKYTMNGTNCVAVRVDPKLKKQIAEAAKIEDRTMAGYIKHLITLDIKAKQDAGEMKK